MIRGLHRIELAALALALHLFAGWSAADEITLQRLYSRPWLWGTAPSQAHWPRLDSRRFAFLWSEEGELFRDLYVGGTPAGQLYRLTDMRKVEPPRFDDDTRSEEERARARRLSPGIGEFAWRPDGKEMVFEYQQDLWRIGARRGAAPTRFVQTRAAESRPAYSPDGRRLAFLRDGNLWRHDFADGSMAQLTAVASGKSILAFQWMPDGRRLQVLESDTSSLKEVLIPDYIPKTVEVKRQRRANAGEPGGVYRFGLVDATGGLVHWCARRADGMLFDVEPSPDGRRLACHEVSPDFKRRALYVVDASSLVSQQVYAETTETWFEARDVEWTRDGRQLLFLSGRDGWSHLYRLPLDSTAAGPQLLTPGDFDVDSFSVPEDAAVVYYEAFRPRPVDRNVYRLDPTTGAAQRLGSLSGGARGSHSSDGNYSLLLRSSLTEPTELYLADSRKPGELRRVTRSAQPGFANVALAQPEYVQFPAPDGHQLWGALFLPPDRRPGQRYPALLTWIYANSAKDDWGHILNHWLATHGYVVLLVDYRGSEGYGESFAKGYYKSMGIIDASECVAAAHYLASLDCVDGRRLGIFGWSYGGFLTHMTLFQHPGVFAAGVSVAPVNDWENYNYYYTGQRLDTPADASDVYKKTSPINLADGLADHLLMIHGMQDDNVLFQDTVKLAQKLIEKNKPFEVMFYPRDDHSISRDESRVHLMQLVVRYFDEHLKTGGPPAPQ